jgi:hypothetical protein
MNELVKKKRKERVFLVSCGNKHVQQVMKKKEEGRRKKEEKRREEKWEGSFPWELAGFTQTDTRKMPGLPRDPVFPVASLPSLLHVLTLSPLSLALFPFFLQFLASTSFLIRHTAPQLAPQQQQQQQH